MCTEWLMFVDFFMIQDVWILDHEVILEDLGHFSLDGGDMPWPLSHATEEAPEPWGHGDGRGIISQQFQGSQVGFSEGRGEKGRLGGYVTNWCKLMSLEHIQSGLTLDIWTVDIIMYRPCFHLFEVINELWMLTAATVGGWTLAFGCSPKVHAAWANQQNLPSWHDTLW